MESEVVELSGKSCYWSARGKRLVELMMEDEGGRGVFKGRGGRVRITRGPCAGSRIKVDVLPRPAHSRLFFCDLFDARFPAHVKQKP